MSKRSVMKAPKPRVKHGKAKTIASLMKMTHKHSTIEHTHFMDEKGRPRHRVEHRQTTTYESQPGRTAWQAGY